VDTTAADPLVGTLLEGRYRVGAKIARGGMATVYEATDTRLHRVVAVKVLHSGYADDEAFVSRFIREARSTARLSHPHVVSVFDQGEDDGTLFLAMEYVPGRTLRDLVREQAPLPPAQALALLEPVLSALAAAHDAGFVHRDVKPENVLITDDGRVKVADFGLVRAVTTATNTATSGVLIGTVSYLAPELVTDGSADARSDVYSAGVLLYELLTGRKPHQGETPIQVAYKHVHEDVPAPSAEVDGIPPYVDALVARATARHRDARSADAKVFLRQLRRVRHALDHGVTDDPDLTEDLTPTPRDAAAEGTVPVTLRNGRPRRQGPARPPQHPPLRGADEGGDTSPQDPAENAAAEKDAAPHARRRSRKRTLGWVGLVVVLLLAAGAAAGGWYLSVGRYTSAPDLSGLTLAEARQRVRPTDFVLRTGPTAYSETVPKGDIISTDPQPGARILRTGTITVVVSKGKERYPMPPVVGVSEAEARDALSHHLAVGDVRHVYSDRVDDGLVISASKDEGTRLRPDTAVDLMVSKGPRPIAVPEVVGDPIADARDSITDRDLTLNVSRTHDSAPKGEVIDQDPDDGTLYEGDEIDLVVSKGPPLTEVPSVFGQYRDSAVEQLEDAGFEVDVEHADGYVGFDLVSAQSPSGSELAPRGSTVTIYLY
jgi:eukaryotic-like serine/threonine-protein kinase